MMRSNTVNKTKGESAANAAILNELYQNDMVLSEVQVGVRVKTLRFFGTLHFALHFRKKAKSAL
jgi:hypothetical protein